MNNLTEKEERAEKLGDSINSATTEPVEPKTVSTGRIRKQEKATAGCQSTAALAAATRFPASDENQEFAFAGSLQAGPLGSENRLLKLAVKTGSAESSHNLSDGFSAAHLGGHRQHVGKHSLRSDEASRGTETREGHGPRRAHPALDAREQARYPKGQRSRGRVPAAAAAGSREASTEGGDLGSPTANILTRQLEPPTCNGEAGVGRGLATAVTQRQRHGKAEEVVGPC